MTTNQFLSSFQFNNGLTLKNRVVMSPMTTMTSFYNGMVTSDELNYYAARAAGPGMVITAVANVADSGKGFEGELSVASDDMIPGLTKLARTLHQNGTKAIMQIFHAGRKSNHHILRGDQPVSASAVAAVYPPDSETPRALTEDEIQQLIVDFGEATRRAIAAGFDGVELHGANTYLLQQFFSPNSNQRTDNWGGSREKRMNFALAVIDAAKSAIKKYADRPFLLGYRISPEEIENPGIRLEDSLYFVDQVKDKIDYLHLSMGNYKRTSLNDKTNTKTLLSQFAAHTNGTIPLIGIGSVETPADANAVLADGGDLVAIGRELLREPQWVQKVASGDAASLRFEISPNDMDELAIPSVMQTYLKTSFHDVMHFSNDANKAQDYQNTMAPMEGFEKKL
ncbi:NADH-dependent flavin oxidoreductase [Secundilactobacillus paracollinoides]|uniref:NADH-dependent flavin oxidoreductase n=1 Tax=Secundilactobacillus paracollinoides TaxID=240427 RepID=A0A1B2J2A6_9LACO|nr:NADH-dependent flavin oxidoreductase [Secundilactobacillus paracollinoides]ANZ62477.1 NADH-dependent flavin oxidoreductase [Secundilactobacillus paracollinoides]ANZ68434.1 NADH-dependent flavin oxidoreductase [Secundilactobacillus paracollinoides]